MKICTVPDCEKKHNAKGFCADHYQRFLRYGDPLGYTPRYSTCTVEGCTTSEGRVVRGLCSVHYYRMNTYGDTITSKAKGRTPAKEKTLAGRVSGGTPSGLPELECWEWTRGRNDQGYGTLKFKGKHYLAHRAAFVVATGTVVPSGIVVRHTCDNPPCVNPSHLILGTHKDNVQDMYARKRAPDRRGERQSRSKLTEPDVVAIRKEHRDGAARGYLADKYGVSGPAIYNIVHRRSWTHVKD